MQSHGHHPGLPPLANPFEDYPHLAQRLQVNDPLLLLDYDGTLAPIAERPELAVLPESTRIALRELARYCPVAIVSGRDRTDVARLVDLESLIYAGSHGFDIRGPGGLHMEHDCATTLLPALDQAETELRNGLADTPGILVERKRFAIAVHYRLASPTAVPTVAAAVDAAVAGSEGQLRRSGGKKLFELRPAVAWDKGQAALWLLQAVGRGRLAVYIGDDETDEDAFSALRQIGGIGILVAPAPRPSAAHYRLDSVEAVSRLLRQLCESLSAAGGSG